MKTWDCPRCGQKTSGSHSEGGLLWAICDSCMNKENKRGEKNGRRNLSLSKGKGKT